MESKCKCLLTNFVHDDGDFDLDISDDIRKWVLLGLVAGIAPATSFESSWFGRPRFKGSRSIWGRECL